MPVVAAIHFYVYTISSNIIGSSYPGVGRPGVSSLVVLHSLVLKRRHDQEAICRVRYAHRLPN